MTKKNNRGRPKLYEIRVEPRLAEIEEWARAGATQKEIAAALGIGYSTFIKYVDEQVELRRMMINAQMSGVPEVKLALLKRALGYEYEEEKRSMRRDEDGVTRQYIETTKKHVAPDTAAIAMYLRNNGDEWKDKDKFAYEFKQMEIELKKKIVDMQEWK